MYLDADGVYEPTSITGSQPGSIFRDLIVFGWNELWYDF